MSDHLTQGKVNKVPETHKPGEQLYDDAVAGLRIRVGKDSSTYRLMGRINDKSGRYVTITIGRTDDISLKTAREQAQDLKRQLRKGLDPRRPAPGTVPTVEEALRRYISSRGSDLSPRSRAWYQDQLRLLAPIKTVPLDRLTGDDCRSLHEGITRKNGSYAANGCLRCLRAIFNDTARTIDTLPPNPVSRAVRFNRSKAREWSMSRADRRQFLEDLKNVDSPIRRTAWLAAYLTGLRSGDIGRMRWDHIEDGILEVPEPKGGQAFRLPLPQKLLDDLDTLPKLGDLCFPGDAKHGGVKLRRSKHLDYPPHQLRHTFRLAAAEAGLTFDETLVLMNHKPPHVSFNYLSPHLLAENLRPAMERVCEVLLADG